MIKKLFLPSLITFFLLGCTSSGGGQSDSGNNSGVIVPAGTQKWVADANVAVDGCRDRIANINQTFLVNTVGDATTVDSSLIKYTGSYLNGALTFSTSTVTGDCVRTYTGTFSQIVDKSSVADFSLKLVCAVSQCENKWSGIATQVTN